MSNIDNFRDLKAWQHNHQIVIKIYQLTKKFPDEERFGLCSQVRRSASSITANISEGFGRYYYKDKIRFYYFARASSVETQNHLLLAADLGYLSKEIVENLFVQLGEGQKMINGLINSLNSR
ncbi:TPA: four helix bundle protein [Candidatus Falkowbacteria bacterium]|nr:four helix bundle protein [Candidatus Falkowbacteria bacterium]